VDDYRGRKLCSVRDAGQLIEVFDDGKSRSLHFGTPARQSSMALDAPDRLQLPYTRAMMAFLLFQPQPETVLMVGLGGGSMAKFLLRHFPALHMDVVERSAAVVELAHRHFLLPQDSRLRIHVDDGARYMACGAKPNAYDAVLLDAYGANGTPSALLGEAFFADCRRRLRPAGVLAANLWGGRRSGFGRAMAALEHAFGGDALQLPVAGRGNIVALAQVPPAPTSAQLQLRSRELQQRLDLPFAVYRRALRRRRRLLKWLLD